MPRPNYPTDLERGVFVTPDGVERELPHESSLRVPTYLDLPVADAERLQLLAERYSPRPSRSALMIVAIRAGLDALETDPALFRRYVGTTRTKRRAHRRNMRDVISISSAPERASTRAADRYRRRTDGQ